MPSNRPRDLSSLSLALTSRSLDWIEPLSRSRAAGRVVDLGVRTESVARRTATLPVGAVQSATGRRSRPSRRRAEELAARPNPATRPTARHKAPVIHWHQGGQGPALLLLNGWTASGLVWPSAWIAALERDFTVIRPDNRGSGWSRTAPLPCTIGDMARDAAQVLRRAAEGPAVVLGLSMGGMIAQELALLRPDLVSGLVVAGSRPPGPRQIASQSSVLRAVLDRPRPGETAADYQRRLWPTMTAPGFPEAHPDEIDELVAQTVARVTPARMSLEQMRAIAAWGRPERMAGIDVPTVVVHGALDRMMPVGNGWRIAQSIRGSRYVELAGVGHLVPLEAPDRLAEVVRLLA